MSVIDNIDPKPIIGFNGMFSRGNVDSVPEDHLSDCYNCIFPGKSQVDLRDPLTIQINATHGNTVSFAVVNMGPSNSAGAVLITLSDTGDLYDETKSFSLIAGVSGTGGVRPDDFQALPIFGRVYITFMYKGKALPGYQIYTYYYSSTRANYICEPIGGFAPVTTPTFTGTSPAVPGCDAGKHRISYSFVNDRGFIGPMLKVPCEATVTGETSIDISVTTNTPANCTQLIFFMTPADQLEMFFIPGGTIGVTSPGGLATYTLSINTADTSLIASADYLNNLMTSIPTCSHLMFYHGRLIVIGQYQFPDDILVSDQGSPETFNLVNNVVHMPVDYGSNTSNGGMIIRDSVYVTKPNGTYVIQDNSNFPSTWPVTLVDSGIGAWYSGISSFDSSMSGQDVSDICLVASERGLMIFDGNYHEIPLTFKVENIWRTVNTIDPAYFYKIQVAHDVWKKRIYIAMPLVSNTINPTFIAQSTNGIILMGDYQEGMTPMNIKWSVWNTGLVTSIDKISVENFTLTFNSDMIYQFCLCGGPNRTKIYKVIPAPGLPDGGASGQTIDQIITTGPVPLMHVGVSTYLMLDFQIEGSGKADVVWYGNNRAFQGGSASINLTAYNTAVDTNLANFSNGNPVIVTINNHKLLNNQMVTITGATGLWAVINGNWNIKFIDANNFSIAANGASLGVVTGTINVKHVAYKSNIQRMINFSSESIYVRLRCDLLIPGGVQGRIAINQIDIYFKKMWSMRPALIQTN